MEELLEILEGIAPGEDFENCTTCLLYTSQNSRVFLLR